MQDVNKTTQNNDLTFQASKDDSCLIFEKLGILFGIYVRAQVK